MDHTFRWGIYDRAPLKTWSTDRITLLGDAAHAVTPHLGQGANQAVEDAITLAVLLQDAQAADVPVRLRRYEDLRIERTGRSMTAPKRPARYTVRPNCRQASKPSGSSPSTTDCNSIPHDAERIAHNAIAALQE